MPECRTKARALCTIFFGHYTTSNGSIDQKVRTAAYKFKKKMACIDEEHSRGKARSKAIQQIHELWNKSKVIVDCICSNWNA